MRPTTSKRLRSAVIVAAFAATLPALASSHREAPGITKMPKVDATDLYVFNSYEAGRGDYVTIVANYIPLQDSYGGPNYFTLDADAVYDINVDNNGDAIAELVFRFDFRTTRKDITLPIGPEGNRKDVAIPLIQAGQIGAGNDAALNTQESYLVNLFRRGQDDGRRLKNAADGSTRFLKPVDNIGNKTIPDYDGYAEQYIYNVTIPGCAMPGRMFVGQRKDPFVVNLGETFDLINIANPIGNVSGEQDDLADKNVTALELEIPKACLVQSASNPVIGVWTTASVRVGRDYSQVSRLGMPLVNEVVIGLKDKDKFNASKPRNDGQFLDYVTHPTLPALIEILFGGAGVKAPTVFPRTDLIAAFLTGLDGLNKTATPSEMIRLNTSIPAKSAALQNNLGALGGDFAGFPNGRRPGDDVVDIELRVAMGALLPLADAPSGGLPFTDGAYVDATFFDDAFPYLKTPIPGSPGEANGK